MKDDDVPDNPWDSEIRRRTYDGEDEEAVRTDVIARYLEVCNPQPDLPLNPAVTQETIGKTICAPGWTKTVRPSARYTARIKIKLIRELEVDEALLVDFELDHRIPLALGGAPSDPRNLELQPWDEAGEKDAIEACLARAVCAGKIGLDEARRRIWSDWRHAGAGCDAGQ